MIPLAWESSPEYRIEGVAEVPAQVFLQTPAFTGRITVSLVVGQITCNHVRHNFFSHFEAGGAKVFGIDCK